MDGGIVTRVDCVTLGIVVNRSGKRFYDEGEDFWPMRYAIWGRLVAQQEEQIAYVLIDSKTIDRFMPSVFPAITGKTIAEVAEKLNLPVDTVTATVDEFNRVLQPGTFDHAILDECKTEGLTPPKTHWAQRLDTPPFYGYPLRPGVTFTYFGVKVNSQAAVIMKEGEAGRKHIRSRRNHVRQYFTERLHRGIRFNHREYFWKNSWYASCCPGQQGTNYRLGGSRNGQEGTDCERPADDADMQCMPLL